MLRLLVPSLVASFLLSASPAGAEDSPSELPPASSTEVARSQWYGWQTLLTDTGSLALLGLAATSDSQGATQLFAFSAVGAFALGGPIVHAAHGRWGIAGADLGIRVGGVMAGLIVGGLIGSAAASSTCAPSSGPIGDYGENCGDVRFGGAVEGAFVGTIVGAVTASAIDASVLARARVSHADDDARPSAFQWSPTITPGRGGASAGVVGTF